MKEFYRNILGSTTNQSTLFNTVSELWNKSKCKVLPTKEKYISILSNKFNHFFADKIDNICDTFSASSAPIITELDMPTGTENSSHLHTFKPATLEELRNIISSKPFKTSFDDPLPKPVYEECIRLLLPFILELANYSLEIGDMAGLKDSTIIPILKKAGVDIELFLNYRPIVNIQLLSKLIEKVV